MKCLEADYISEIWMNERSIWTVIRFDKLINIAHTLERMHVSVTCSHFIVWFNFPPSKNTFWCTCVFLLKLLLHHDLRCCVIFISTINLWLAAPAVHSLNINILHPDMLHQPNMNRATHWNSIYSRKWCTSPHTGNSEANSCGSDISKSPKPIKANWIKVIQ